jgi:dihydroorotate dehydrogenase (NAD+) catalytic subunit
MAMAKTVLTSLSLCGTKLSNPLVLAAGPYGRDSKTLTRAVNAGFGAVTTKTMRLVAARNPFPNVAQTGRDTLINAEKWSDLPLQSWVRREIPCVKRLGVPLIASVGFTAREARKIVPLVENAGADFIETVTYDADEILPMVKAVKPLLKVPLIVKVSANWQHLSRIVVKAERLGANAISAIDSVGPALAIDVETGRPILGSAGGEGWLSGSAIHSLAVKCVAEMARSVRIPVIGIGGVSSGRDVAEMIMAGAHCVGLCTAPILHGLQVVERVKTELAQFMDRKGYRSVREMRGLALKHLENQRRENRERMYPKIGAEACTLCGLCESLCPYQALTLSEERVVLNMGKCLSCGLCYSVCPQHAIALLGR